jgi:MYXO-CTERM domain-containing protein
MFRSCAFALATAACALAPSLARAEVLTFQFTGRITNTILQSGMQQASAPAPDSWLGLLISGSIRMDLTTMEPRLLEPGYSQVSKTFDRPFSQWLTVTVNQPDGSSLVIPSGPVLDLHVDPAFCPECDDASSYLSNAWVPSWSPGSPAQDSFYVQRTLIDGIEQFPRQQFQLNLRGIGPQADGLVDSADYRQAHFNPSLANWDNFGYVEDFPSAGHHSSYAFTVLSLSSQVAAVPEPSVYALAGAGALVLLLAARRRREPRMALRSA